MTWYKIVVTNTLNVEAETEDEAINKAIDKLECNRLVPYIENGDLELRLTIELAKADMQR